MGKIKWRLRQLMAEYNITNAQLSRETGIHVTSVSRLKNSDNIKNIRVDLTLAPLIKGLNALYRKKGNRRPLRVGDLMVYEENSEEPDLV